MNDKAVFKRFCSFTEEYCILICLDSICLSDGFKKCEKAKNIYCQERPKNITVGHRCRFTLGGKGDINKNKGFLIVINQTVNVNA